MRKYGFEDILNDNVDFTHNLKNKYHIYEEIQDNIWVINGCGSICMEDGQKTMNKNIMTNN